MPVPTQENPGPNRLVDVGSGGFAARFVGASKTVLSGLPFTLRNRKLLWLVGAPIAIQIVVFVVFVVFGARALVDLVAGVDLGIAEGSTWHFLEGILDFVLGLIAFLGAFVVGLLLTLMVGNILAGPVLDVLSERTEGILVGEKRDAPFSLAGFVGEIVTETIYAIIRLSVFLCGLVLVFLVGLIPAVGQVVAPIGSVVWTSLFLAVEILNAPLARHGIRGFRRLALLLGNLSITLGLGLTAWVCSFVPVSLPFLVVGATRLYVGLAVNGRVPSRFDDDTKARLAAPRST